jgi:hypothetical protein
MPVPETIRLALFWTAALAFAIAQAGLVLVQLRGSGARPDAGTGAAERARVGRAVELLMVLAPAALLALLLVNAWHTASGAFP